MQKTQITRVPVIVRTALKLMTVCMTLGLVLSQTGCMSAYKQSVGADTQQSFTRVYLTDFSSAWESVLDSLKSMRLDVTNREGGFVQTRWMENTADKNFTDSFGNADAYLKAQFRLRVSVAKGFYNGRPSVKISVTKEQMVQRDVLEGWQRIESDHIDENTFLYRIGRIIFIRMRLAQIEEEKTKKAIESSTF